MTSTVPRLHLSLGALLVAAVLSGCGASSTDAAEPAGAATVAAAEPAVAFSNARSPEPGLVTGGQPTRAELEEARAAGFVTVVSLRAEGEPGSEGEAEAVEALGMRFVSIPVPGAEGLTEENARALGAVLEDPEAKPLLLHCSTGNRSGALLALEAFFVRGLSAEAALELGRAAGLSSLEPAVRSQLGL